MRVSVCVLVCVCVCVCVFTGCNRYDMVYGDRYCSHKLLETLVAAANSQQSQ